MLKLTPSLSFKPSFYKEKGFVLWRSFVDPSHIDELLQKYVSLINDSQKEGLVFQNPHDPALAQYLTKERVFQSYIYDKVREYPWLEDFVKACALDSALNKFVQEEEIAPEAYLLKKIIFRMDMPLEVSELALWHQDYFYVGGNTEVITAWIPLQDTFFEHGCLSVMPGSHQAGILQHPKNLLKKKWVPEGIYDREIRLVEMKKGDVLIFNSLLLHSSNLNVSTIPRYSLQVRFTPHGYEMPPQMGGILTSEKETPYV